MAIIIEDGTGLSNAQSYCDVAFVASYYTLRGNSTYVPTEAHIIKAMDYIENTYSLSWIGEKLVSTQSLAFPRLVDGVDIGVPINVKNAVADLCLRAAGGSLITDQTEKVTERTVGPLTTKYAEYSNPQTQYTSVYNLLKPYLSGSSSSHKVVRA